MIDPMAAATSVFMAAAGNMPSCWPRAARINENSPDLAQSQGHPQATRGGWRKTSRSVRAASGFRARRRPEPPLARVN